MGRRINGDFLLGHDHRVAGGAMGARRLALCRTCSGNSGIFHDLVLGMGRGINGDFLLGHDHRVAGGAMRARRFALCRTGGGNSSVLHDLVCGMGRGVNVCFLCTERFAAGASIYGFPTRCTGRRDNGT